MATTGVINTTSFALYHGATPTKIAHSTGASISLSHDPRDITTKDSAGWTELLEGIRGWEGSIEGLHAMDDVAGANILYNAVLNRTALSVVFTTNVTGDKKFSGTVYLTSCELGAPGQEDNATYNASFTGTGAITVTTV